MRADHDSTAQPEAAQAGEVFRPRWAEMFLYMGVMFVLLFATVLLFGVPRPEEAPVRATAAYVGVLFGVWLVALPAVQYVLIKRLSGTRPRLRWGAFYPYVFGPWHAPGAKFGRMAFALVCALPALCVVTVLAPVGTIAWRQGVETVPEVAVVVAGGLSIYFLRYTIWTLSRPGDTRVEVLEEAGLVRAK